MTEIDLKGNAKTFGESLLQRAVMRTSIPLSDSAKVKVLVDDVEVPFVEVVDGLKEELGVSMGRLLHEFLDDRAYDIKRSFEKALNGVVEEEKEKLRELRVNGVVDRWVDELYYPSESAPRKSATELPLWKRMLHYVGLS
jgi:hypothetical protein